MAREFNEYVELVREKKMTMTEACAELGISRQTWYNRLRKPGGFVSKAKLEQRVADLEMENTALIEGMMGREQSEWAEKLDKANQVMCEFLDKTFPRLWCNLRFEHADAAAYWYSFELVNDDRRQTWCVRHNEVS